MKKTLVILAVLIALAFLAYLSKGDVSDESSKANELKELTFPQDWFGTWSGDLEIFGADGLMQKVPMKAIHGATESSDTFVWSLVYGADDVAGLRDYRLVAVDSAQGHYQVDEQNSIMLDAFLRGNQLVSVFEVMGNTLTSTYTLDKDIMTFEILMFKQELAKVTGGEVINGDTIPTINSFPVAVRQVAKLTRVE